MLEGAHHVLPAQHPWYGPHHTADRVLAHAGGETEAQGQPVCREPGLCPPLQLNLHKAGVRAENAGSPGPEGAASAALCEQGLSRTPRSYLPRRGPRAEGTNATLPPSQAGPPCPLRAQARSALGRQRVPHWAKKPSRCCSDAGQSPRPLNQGPAAQHVPPSGGQQQLKLPRRAHPMNSRATVSWD